MRLFISINVPNNVKEIAIAAKAKADEQKAFKARWVGYDNLHITLAFMAEVAEESVKYIVEKLDQIHMEEFTIKLGSLAAHPWRRPHVLWIDLMSNQLEELALTIHKELHDFVREQQSFKGHLTLARIKQVYNRQELREYIEGFQNLDIQWNISDFSLQQSILTDKEPVYNSLYTFKLAKKLVHD